MRRYRTAIISVFVLSIAAADAAAQSLGNAGTVEGLVTDASGAVVSKATVEIRNSITSYRQATTSDAAGSFRFTGVPPNPYRLTVSAPGFSSSERDVSVRTAVPISLKFELAVAGSQTTVNVEASGATQVENVPSSHTDVDETLFSKLATLSPGSGLNDAILLTSPSVAADSNGFFHPLGDHAQVSYSIDGQPISDQQSKLFSTQIPLNAINSMELITGAPNAEFGDKTSLVVNAATRSGLGQKPNGSFVAHYGSFGTVSEETSVAFGTPRLGNSVVFNAVRSGRFLDTPEFSPVHAVGNNGTFFDRLDFQPSGKDAIHLNLFAARNWFQIPNNYDQPGQDQRQKVATYNIAPGYQHTFSAHTLLTINPFVRRDHVNYYPSGDPFDDQPATLSQARYLTNYGLKADISYSKGAHNVKIGTQLMQTHLNEKFNLGITDPLFNAVCVDQNGDPLELPRVTDPAACSKAGRGFSPNPDLQPGLIPFDLSRSGSPFQFAGKAHVNQYAFYVQDQISVGKLTLSPGLRVDQYNGLTSEHGVQPRFGISYLVKRTGTVLRAAYSRTFETPYNENLIVSSATGVGGLATNVFGAFGETPIKPGRRNQYNAGLQQGIGRFLQVDADYFWKFTDNAYDFDTLFSTPVAFPISWRKSKLDGVGVRLSTPDLKGFQVFTTMGHTRARYFGPEIGGIIFNSPLNNSVFRIDHDQAFQQTTIVRYQRPHNGPWINFTWRYDSGLVNGSIPDIDTALSLTGAEQSAIGFFCGSQRPTLTTPITTCSSGGGTTRLRIPAEGAENDDTNPGRVAPRHVFNLGVGTENLFHREHKRVTARFTVLNLTNKVALYNFLSTFSGTHFLAPRTYEGAVGFVF